MTLFFTNGITQVVEQLVTEHPVSENNLRVAITEAIAINDSAIVKVLRDKLPEIDLLVAINLAILSKKDLDLIKTLNEKLSEESRLVALKFSVLADHTASTEILSVSEDDHRVAIGLALANGHLAVIKTLSHKISEQDRYMFLAEAIKYTSLEIVKILLDSGPISEKNRGDLVCKSLTNHLSDCAEELLNSGSISLEDGTAALMIAVENSNREIVKKILKDYQMTSETLAAAREISIKNQQNEITVLFGSQDVDVHLQDKLTAM